MVRLQPLHKPKRVVGPSRLPLANSHRETRLSHSRMVASLSTFDSCTQIIKSAPRLRTYLNQAAALFSLNWMLDYPLSLRSWLLGQPLLIPPTHRPILQRTLCSLLRTQRLRHKNPLQRMRLRQRILLSRMRHRSLDAGKEKTVHFLRMRGSYGRCGYIARRCSQLKLPN